VPTQTDELFGLAVPTQVPSVPPEVMRPRDTWSDPAAYDAQARKLAEMFKKNFEKFGSNIAPAIAGAGPRV
jgi:phosphoenolpyruvate carboxykinase (ATP)